MTPAFSSAAAFLAMGGYALYVWLAVAAMLLIFGFLTLHTCWQRRALFRELSRQQARERRIVAARRRAEAEGSDANAS
ncbi:heme exporter protein CcmD [Raoultella planticola]|uniref:heme exporter protein CcmD n=1 Tax=Raoultella planticola TaxID=575 RepID=UPI0013D091A4|nr:heme exporter protein CcmD [Raoultella planticola]